MTAAVPINGRFAVYVAGPSFKGDGIVDFTTTDSHPTMQDGA